jgi:signal transduction histidine kinase/ActR/RegA family two-component response regulator
MAEEQKAEGNGAAVSTRQPSPGREYRLLRRWMLALALLWTLVIGGALFWLDRHEVSQGLAMARIEAKGYFERDLLYRRWAAGHGGVYVPVTPATPPNPYLAHVPEREIQTPSGKQFTLINPAYMSRQVYELAEKEETMRGHITSRNPLRPDNAPDTWEESALAGFEQGVPELFGTVRERGERWLRYMRPLRTEERCLKCHAAQGYRVGDIRGGISVSIPLRAYDRAVASQRAVLCQSHLILWLLGLVGIGLGWRSLAASLRARDAAAARAREHEERLRQSEKMQAIGQLAGGVAHDFNNQLMGIMGYAELLADHLESASLKRYAEQIIIATNRAADLTKQLLAFSRKGKYLSMPVDTHQIIREVVALLARSIDKRIEIRQELRADPYQVLGDPSHLQNALLNLAVNARDAMPDGGRITFETSIAELKGDATDPEALPGRYLQIAVSDTGSGMDDATMKRIFEPFFTTKEQGKGTGLGLAAVHGAVKSHRGRIEVRSRPGEGSTFVVSLPLPDQPLVVNGEKPLPLVRGAARILVVDDEEVCRALATELLQSLGYAVMTCTDGEEAIRIYRQSWREIDLVILDMVMPRMGGCDTYLAMRQVNPALRAILVSGHSMEGMLHPLLDSGVRAFVQKPFSIAVLSRTVAAALKAEHPAAGTEPLRVDG